MTPAQQVQDVLLSMASTVVVWRDFAIAGLAALVVILIYTAASAR